MVADVLEIPGPPGVVVHGLLPPRIVAGQTGTAAHLVHSGPLGWDGERQALAHEPGRRAAQVTERLQEHPHPGVVADAGVDLERRSPPGGRRGEDRQPRRQGLHQRREDLVDEGGGPPVCGQARTWPPAPRAPDRRRTRPATGAPRPGRARSSTSATTRAVKSSSSGGSRKPSMRPARPGCPPGRSVEERARPRRPSHPGSAACSCRPARASSMVRPTSSSAAANPTGSTGYQHAPRQNTGTPLTTNRNPPSVAVDLHGPESHPPEVDRLSPTSTLTGYRGWAPWVWGHHRSTSSRPTAPRSSRSPLGPDHLERRRAVTRPPESAGRGPGSPSTGPPGPPAGCRHHDAGRAPAGPGRRRRPPPGAAAA